MSQFQQLLLNAVNALTNRFNSMEANAKKTDELPQQTTLNNNSKVRLSFDGVSQWIYLSQVFNVIRNQLFDRLVYIGTIALVENVITFPSGARWILNENNYLTASDIDITIPYSDEDKVRKDIFVANSSGDIVRVAGFEYTDFALRPNVPIGTIFITEVDVSHDSIGSPIDPIYPNSALYYGTYSDQDNFDGLSPRGVYGAFAFMLSPLTLILHNGTEWLYAPLKKTPSNLYNQYNGTSVTVPSGFTLTRIVSLNDINTVFTGIVTGTDLVITDGVSGDIYLIDGYTI